MELSEENTAIVNLYSIKTEIKEETCDIESAGIVKDGNKMEISEYNLTDFLDEVKTKDIIGIKEENKEIKIDHFSCDQCGLDYQGYCLACPSLSHFLNNTIPRSDSDWKMKTIPSEILQIRNTFIICGVFALKLLPNNVIFGPFEGVKPIESIKGWTWKIKDGKLVNIENGNWMQCIANAVSVVFKNLQVFQFGGKLYYQTCREIKEGEELLVHYNEEEIQTSDTTKESYYTPLLEEKSQKVFGCTFCCLGFKLEKFLIEHRNKCPWKLSNNDMKEIIECTQCNLYLESQEYMKHHSEYCLQNPARTCGFPTNATDERIIVSPPDTIPKFENLYETNVNCHQFLHQNPNRNNEKKFKCSQCPYQSNFKYTIHEHMNAHSDVKRYRCDICQTRFKYKNNLHAHNKDKHRVIETKDYSCPRCEYQTNKKAYFRKHLNTHSGDVSSKTFRCDICLVDFVQKTGLKRHIKKKHTEGITKDHKCTECAYETYDENDLKIHQKYKHHREADRKEVKCAECSYETNYKSNLRLHVRNKHSDAGATKAYNCPPQCEYETNDVTNIKRHLTTHTTTTTDVRLFRCEICQTGFHQKSHLNSHIDDKHRADSGDKDYYSCSRCEYRTNRKSNLRKHRYTHSSVRKFACDICEAKFKHENNLKGHKRMKHGEGTPKVYQCTRCPYNTIYCSNLRKHTKIHNK